MIQTLVLPKIHSMGDLDKVSQTISQCFSSRSTKKPIQVVASIESARSLWSLGEIAAWKSREGVANVFALLVCLSFAILYILMSGGEVCGRGLYAFFQKRGIANWKCGLLVCADTSIIRTPSRQELLYPRSKIALAAKVFQLQAIDMARLT